MWNNNCTSSRHLGARNVSGNLCLVYKICKVLIFLIPIHSFVLTKWKFWVNPIIVQVPVSFIVPINLVIFMFTCLYEVILSIDALYHRNNLLLFAICISNVCVLVFSGMHTRQIKETSLQLLYDDYGATAPLVNTKVNFWKQVQWTQIACPIVFGVCSLIIWPCAYQLHREYAWAIYREVRGDAKIKSRYLSYEVRRSVSVMTQSLLTNSRSIWSW